MKKKVKWKKERKKTILWKHGKIIMKSNLRAAKKYEEWRWKTWSEKKNYIVEVIPFANNIFSFLFCFSSNNFHLK